MEDKDLKWADTVDVENYWALEVKSGDFKVADKTVDLTDIKKVVFSTGTNNI